MIVFKEYVKGFKIRAFGWIQDSSDFNNLHKFVSIFSHNSAYRPNLISKIEKIVIEEKKPYFLEQLSQKHIKLKYGDIVGTSPKGSRKTETICDGIGQASIEGQKRDFIGDWPTDNFLRWAVTLRFLEYNCEDDTYIISQIGEKFVETENRIEQKEIILKQLTYYPPVIRILELLHQKNSSKFGLGEYLGFIGEKGFTYITENLYVKSYIQANDKERKKLRSDFEGSSDKYARQISSWLYKIGLIDKITHEVDGVIIPSSYSINPKGINFLRKYKSSPKYIPFGMLSMESNNKSAHCKRRAIILKQLEEKTSTLSELSDGLKKYKIFANIQIIKDDLNSLINMGLDIALNDDKYTLSNKIEGLEIPIEIQIDKLSVINEVKENLREKLDSINHDLLNILDYSISKRSSRMFEVYVYKAFYELTENTYLYGGPNKPDVVSIFDNIVLLIDAKAYKDGFSLPMSEQDKMVRYISELKDNISNYEWRNSIIHEYPRKTIGFNFTSSGFTGTINGKLENIFQRTKISGSCINVIELLILINEFKKTMIDVTPYFTCNKEIEISDQDKLRII